VENIKEIIADPYTGVRVSLLVSCKDYNQFELMCDTLLSSSNTFDDVEILLKTDDHTDIEKYFKILDNSIFKYKILIYPPLNRILSNHIAYNNLYGISSGELIWAIGPDCRIIRGDWRRSILKILDKKMYKDNIFNIAVPMDNGKGYKQICGINIVTREWCDVLGCVAPVPNVDRWISELARKIGRYHYTTERELLSHYPKGHRTLSKKQRKEVFYPLLGDAINKFKEKIRN